MFRWMVCLLLMSGLALAHAEYKSSVPAAGATVRTPPKTVRLTFTEAVEVRLSTFKVYPLEAPPEAWGSPTRLRRLAADLVKQALPAKNDAARRVDAGLATTARTSQTVILNLKPNLRPGPYVVMWRNLGVDGHPETGYFVFVYKP